MTNRLIKAQKVIIMKNKNTAKIQQ